MTLTLNASCLLLSSKGILVKKFIDGSISDDFPAFFSNLWLKIFSDPAIHAIFVFFIFECIKSIKDSSLFFSLLSPWVSLGLECIFAHFLRINTLLEVALFLFNFFSKVFLVLQKLLKSPVASFFCSFGLECAFCIGSFFLLLLEFTDLPVFFCKSLIDLFSDLILFELELLNSFLFAYSFFLDEFLQV